MLGGSHALAMMQCYVYALVLDILQDMYQFMMLKGEMMEPFVVYTLLPRSPVPLSGLSLLNVDIHGHLLITEADVETDSSLFFGTLVCFVVELRLC